MTKYINRSQFGGIAGKRPGNPKAVFIHNDASRWDASEWANGQLANHNPNSGFAHYYISDGVVFRAEDTYNCAWHCGNGYWNTWGLSYEVCDSYGDKDKFLRSEQECFKQVAEDMKFYGIPVNMDTVRLHQEVYATACPHRSMELHGNNVNAVKRYFISQINKYMTGDKASVDNTPKPPKNPTYWHSSKVKAVKVLHEIGVYDEKSLSKAKTVGKLKEGQEVKVLDIWKEGNEKHDMSRLQIEYKGKTAWITGNAYYVESCYYLTGDGKKIKALKDTDAYSASNLTGAKEHIKKGTVLTVIDNVADKSGYARFKLKSGKYVTARRDFWKFV